MVEPMELLHKYVKANKNKNAKEATAEAKAFKLTLNDTPIETAATASAVYRFALYLLYEEHKLKEAETLLQKVIGADFDNDDTAQARITYAICLAAQAKPQKAILELKKLLKLFEAPNIHTSIARDYLVIFLRDSDAPADLLAKAEKDRIDELELLASKAKPGDDKAQFELRLASAFEERNLKGDKTKAIKLLQRIANAPNICEKTLKIAAAGALKRIHRSNA